MDGKEPLKRVQIRAGSPDGLLKKPSVIQQYGMAAQMRRILSQRRFSYRVELERCSSKPWQIQKLEKERSHVLHIFFSSRTWDSNCRKNTKDNSYSMASNYADRIRTSYVD